MRDTNVTIRKSNCFFNLMPDILDNFCNVHNLEHASADEITWKTEEQRKWLRRFCNTWDKVADRASERR